MPARVLLIGDDPHMAELVSGFLRAEDYEVRWSKNGVEALQAADVTPPDLVLLDVEMPGMNEYEVCRVLRHGRRTGQVPVVMLTATADPALNRTAYAAGVQACVPKPYRRDGLLAAMTAAVACIPKERPEQGRKQG